MKRCFIQNKYKIEVFSLLWKNNSLRSQESKNFSRNVIEHCYDFNTSFCIENSIDHFAFHITNCIPIRIKFFIFNIVPNILAESSSYQYLKLSLILTFDIPYNNTWFNDKTTGIHPLLNDSLRIFNSLNLFFFRSLTL